LIEVAMTSANDIQDILHRLTIGQRALLLEIAVFMQAKIERNENAESNLLSKKFTEDFTNRLLIHHATNEDKLKKKSFEFAFKAASLSAGRRAIIVANQTNPGADVIVDNTSYSLKTEASASIRDDELTISKLMEARWIRDCTSNKDFVRGIKDHVLPHFTSYQRIICLRAFDRPDKKVEYELLEIPLKLLHLCGKILPKDFTGRTQGGSNSAWVKRSGTRVFKITFDGSVEKVTISNLRKDCCIFHGAWKIPLVGVSGS
jgi:hypothetical protein